MNDTTPSTTPTTSTLLADFVIADPSAARVFERHHLDYCCGGQRSLADACTDAGLDAHRVLDELIALEATPSRPLVADDIAGLIGQIVTEHHTYLRRELPRLTDLMGKVVAAHGDRHPHVFDIAATLTELSNDLLPHLAKEEQILFPLTIQLLGAVERTEFHCGSVMNSIRVMHAEHDRAGELLATLRQQADDYTPPADACPTWRALYGGLADLEADTHHHVHLENNVLFPRILGLDAGLPASVS